MNKKINVTVCTKLNNICMEPNITTVENFQSVVGRYVKSSLLLHLHRDVTSRNRPCFSAYIG